MNCNYRITDHLPSAIIEGVFNHRSVSLRDSDEVRAYLQVTRIFGHGIDLGVRQTLRDMGVVWLQ